MSRIVIVIIGMIYFFIILYVYSDEAVQQQDILKLDITIGDLFLEFNPSEGKAMYLVRTLFIALSFILVNIIYSLFLLLFERGIIVSFIVAISFGFYLILNKISDQGIVKINIIDEGVPFEYFYSVETIVFYAMIASFVVIWMVGVILYFLKK
jgi:hypothetical protein